VLFSGASQIVYQYAVPVMPVREAPDHQQGSVHDAGAFLAMPASFCTYRAGVIPLVSFQFSCLFGYD